MAKAVVTQPAPHWRVMAMLAGENPQELMWNPITSELEMPTVSQANLDIVVADYDDITPAPTSWLTTPDLSTVSGTPSRYWKVDTGAIVVMLQAEKDTVDASILHAFKEKMDKLIDLKINDSIHNGPGFEWPPASGNFFSMSANAQTKWIGAMLLKDFMTTQDAYPLTVPTIDDHTFYDIVDAAELANVYYTVSGTIKELVAAGTTAKQNVENATTIPAAQTAADAYLTP